MGRAAIKKKNRHAFLLEKIKEDPFLKDEELADECNVSVATIRIDRAELGIKEYRERIKSVAKNVNKKTKAELLDLNVLKDGIAVLETDDTMTFDGTDIIKGQSIYAFAESLALSVIDAKAALVRVANVKYVREVHKGDKLVAKSKLMRIKEDSYIVHVFIKTDMREVFRGKFSLFVPTNEGGSEL